MKRIAIVLSVLVIISILLIPACAKPAPTATPVPAAKAPAAAPTTVPAAPATAAPTAKPAAPAIPKTELVLSHQYPHDTTFCTWARTFKSSVEKASNSQITVKEFAEKEMYSAYEEMVKAVGASIIQMSVTTQSGIATLAPNISVVTVPGLLSTSLGKPLGNRGDAFWNSESAGGVIRKEAEAKGIKILSYWYVSESNLYFPKPWMSMAELKGKKMRSASGKPYSAQAEALAVQSLKISSAEAYMAVKQGMVDFAGTTPDGYLERKMYEVLPYWLANAPQAPVMAFPSINMAAFNKLGADGQKIVLDAVKVATTAAIKSNAEMLTGIEAEYAKVKVIRLDWPKAEVEKMAAGFEATWPQFYEDFGKDLMDASIKINRETR